MVNWSELLPELVLEIGKGITFYEDFVSFSKVCSAWQSAIREWDDFRRIPCRFPSLLVVDDKQQDCKVHLLDGTVREVQLPLPNPKLICLSSIGGWLFIVEQDTTQPKLFHPFSGRQIDLPDFKSLPKEFNLDLDEGFAANRAWVLRVVLSSDPTIVKEEELIVMVVCGRRGYLAFCKPRDSSWTPVTLGWRNLIDDLCYYDGKAYTLDGQGHILSCDLHSKNPAMQPVSKRPLIGLEGILELISDRILPPLDENHRKMLVVYRSYEFYDYSDEEVKNFPEDYLTLWFSADTKPYYLMTRSFKLLECDLETGEWAKVENLGSKSIFVGLSCSFTVEASDCVKPNCIYFTDCGNILLTDDGVCFNKMDTGIYHLSDGSIEPRFDVKSLSWINNPMWVAPPNLY